MRAPYEHMALTFGVSLCTLDMGAARDQRAPTMIRADTYQRQLLDYLFDADLAQSTTTTTTTTSTSTATMTLKRTRTEEVEEEEKEELSVTLDRCDSPLVSSLRRRTRMPERLHIDDFGGKCGLSVRLLRGNLLDQSVSVIVNAANTKLVLGGNLAIHLNWTK